MSQPEMLPDNIGNQIGGPFDVGYKGDGKVLKPGATFGDGMFDEDEQSLEDKAEDLGILQEGLSANPQTPELSPAQKAARKMEKLIRQIEESNGSSNESAIRISTFEQELLRVLLISTKLLIIGK